MQAAAASADTRTCPSAPVFQKRIRNAGVTAMEMQSKTAVPCRVTQSLREDPNVPSKIAL